MRTRRRGNADAWSGGRESIERASPNVCDATAALLHALARVTKPRAGARGACVTEDRLDTWRRFRGRLETTDFLALLFEDAAVIHQVPFDAEAVGGPLRLDSLPSSIADAWIAARQASDLKSANTDYIIDQAKLLDLPTRMARSDLLHVVKPHQKVLELPGTGGQLAHHLVSSQRDLTLQENFVIACGTWQELTLAGVVGLELGAPHRLRDLLGRRRRPSENAEHPLRQRSFDFVVGLHPENGGLFRVEDQLAIWFPSGEDPAGVAMPAHFIPIGEPAHDAERQALRFLVEGLPADYSVYGNPWLVERSGVIFELDAVVVAPHAIFVVEIKSYRGRVDGTDNDWWLPEKIRSPLKLNRLTSQVLKTHLRNVSYQAGQVWTEGLVFLSATTDVGVRGPASNDRVHTRKTILAALQDPALIERLSQGRAQSPSSIAQRELLELFTGAQRGPKPVRRVREYEVIETLDHQDTFTELLGKNTLSSAERVLRIYSIPPLATDAQRDRVVERARWEAQVLGRLGRSEGILSADPPFSDEAGIVLPLEYFKGITLTTWVERYGPDTRGKEKADLRVRTDLWMRVAQTLDDAHRQGVVHRLLRPEVVLVEDRLDPQQIRVTGFDLAKQLTSDATISLTSVADDRLIFAAPEVVTAFSSAEPASDQFSLGAILALILTGKPLFDNTRKLMAARRLMRRVRDMAQRIPLSLDEAVARMVELRPTIAIRSLADAIEAVRLAREPEARTLPGVLLDRKRAARCRQSSSRHSSRHRLRGRVATRTRRYGRRLRRAPPDQRPHPGAQDRAHGGRGRGSAPRRVPGPLRTRPSERRPRH